MNFFKPEPNPAEEGPLSENKPATETTDPFEQDVNAYQEQPSYSLSEAEPWAKSLVKAVAFADSHPARIIGITGIRSKIGAGHIAHEFARTYSQYGNNVLFVDATGPNLNEEITVSADHIFDLASLSSAETKNLFHIKLANQGFVYPANSEFFRNAFEGALENFNAIVVNLPSVEANTGRPAQAFLKIGAACQSVFLVCVTGRTTQVEIRQCMASCKINGTRLDGIFLNDSQMPLSAILSDI